MPRTKTFDPTVTLEKAMEVFWDKGYNATSMQDLVEGLGINRASLYDTYKDKHSLFLAALKCYRDKMFSWFDKMTDNSDSPMDALKMMIYEPSSAEAMKRQMKGCFLRRAILEFSNSDKEVDKIAKDTVKLVHKKISSLIIAAQADGDIPADKDPKILAAFLFSSLNGIIVTGMTDRDPKTFRGIADYIYKTLTS